MINPNRHIRCNIIAIPKWRKSDVKRLKPSRDRPYVEANTPERKRLRETKMLPGDAARKKDKDGFDRTKLLANVVLPHMRARH